VGRSVDSEKASREDSAPKAYIDADADAVSLAEGSIRATVRARLPGAAGVPSPRRAFKDSTETWESSLFLSSRFFGNGPPDPNGPGPGVGRDVPTRGAKKHLAEEVPVAKETEAAGTEREQSYAPHSSDEGGELAQPGPTRGKEGTSGRIEERKHGGT